MNQYYLENITKFNTERILKFGNFIREIPEHNNLSFKWLNEVEKSKIEHKTFQKNTSSNLNIFNFFQINEVKHSELLAFLLNPYDIHGQDDLFLKLFLNYIGIKPILNEKWRVQCEIDRVDIMLICNNPFSRIIIENKSNYANDQPNQLYRYWFYQIYNSTSIENSNILKERIRIFYLTPHEEKNYVDDSITRPNYFPNHLPEKIPMAIEKLTFKNDISNIINLSLSKINQENVRLKEYLIQYKSLIENL
jgi:hypothetical protein